MLQSIHHIAIICSDYKQSKDFYCRILGLEIIAEVYREERQSYKLDLALNGQYCIELFSFPDAPKRPSYPEAQGLRHLAFGVNNLPKEIERLAASGGVPPLGDLRRTSSHRAGWLSKSVVKSNAARGQANGIGS